MPCDWSIPFYQHAGSYQINFQNDSFRLVIALKPISKCFSKRDKIILLQVLGIPKMVTMNERFQVLFKSDTILNSRDNNATNLQAKI